MQPLSGTYSFMDVQATLLANSMSISMGQGGIAEEGIRYVMTRDKNTMTLGADGSGMHSLHAADGGRVTINLLKMSPVNAQLNSVYRFQKSSSAFWGRLQLTINLLPIGDNISCNIGAFVKHADVGYAVEGGFLVWEFDFVSIVPTLGNGYQTTNLGFAVAA